METLATVLTCPIKDCWATSIDLKDAYLHVPIYPNDQKWLKFRVKDQTYMFRCLPFGLSTAPRVFTRIVKTVAAYLRRKGLNLCVYLDDWLIYSRSRVEALHHIKMVQETVTSLGFVINVKKSNFVPTQIPQFLGARLHLSEGLARPSPERIMNIIQCVKILSAESHAPATAWLRVRFPAPLPQLTITTDASKMGWGSYSGSDGFGPVVPNGSQVSHQLVRTLGGRKNDPGVRRSVDGLQVHSAVGQFDGGSIHQQTRRYKISPVVHAHSSLVEEVSPSRNVTQGYPHSRGHKHSSGRPLSRSRCGPDRMGTVSSGGPNHLPSNVLSDSGSVCISKQPPTTSILLQDARSKSTGGRRTTLELERKTAYAFPPISLLQRVIQKIASEDCNIILIAPFWPRHLWFRPMVNLLIGTPRFLPQLPDLLRQQDLETVVPTIQLGHLRLTAWPLSGNAARRAAFHKKLLTSSPTVEKTQHSESILDVWVDTTSGAKRQIALLPEQLSLR
ncbi:uncharacterized protein [Amphiura filiformis]|uniref:uncharacterized protein n=1 Tax=Amphiura filiformis TaxID=82378 RepID=UPI003B223635